MRVFTSKQAEAYIYYLATSIGKDPASLESWRCLHVKAEHLLPARPAPFTPEDLMHAARTHYQARECDLICCPDHDFLLVSKSLGEQELAQLGKELADMFLADCSTVHVHTYDLFYDWRDVRALLLDKAEGTPVSPLPVWNEENMELGEFANLREVFDSMRNVRKARLPLHILLVEDDPITRRLVTQLFKENYAVITAKDGQEALTNYLLHAPDLVFLDINLPDASGFAVLRAILASDPDAYVVMFSGNSYLDNVTHALNMGASGFVPKPFKREKMNHYIEDCAMQHRKNSMI